MSKQRQTQDVDCDIRRLAETCFFVALWDRQSLKQRGSRFMTGVIYIGAMDM